MNPNPMFWANKRVCVTGGTGFLGYHIVQQLLALGSRVHVLALRPKREHPLLNDARVATIFGDVRDADLARQAMQGCDVVFHAAGVVATWGPGLKLMRSVHLDGTRNILDAAPSDSRVVHTSSLVAVGGSRTPQVLDEQSPFELQSLRVDYVHAKRDAEQIALEAAGRGRNVVVTNPGYLVGPDDIEYSIMGRICRRFWKGRLPLFPSRGGLNLVDVRDVARGHLLAAEHGRSGHRYLMGGENRTFAEFMKLLADTAGWRPRALVRLPIWLLGIGAAMAETRSLVMRREPYPSFQSHRMDRYYWFCRSDRARHELGYEARPLAEALADTYRWFQSHGKVRLRGAYGWWMRPGKGMKMDASPDVS